MAEELFIPKMGQTVEEVKIINWLVEDGVKVEMGAPVMEVETDKAIFTVEANAKGYLHKGPFEADQVVPVLTVIGIIGKQDDAFTLSAAQTVPSADDTTTTPQLAEKDGPESKPAELSAEQTGERIFVSPRARRVGREENVDPEQLTPTGGGGMRVVEQDVLDYLADRQKATPLAARMAAAEGVDLNAIQGTGPKGTVVKADVLKAVDGAAAPAPAAEVINRAPLSGVRGVIFDRMGASVHTTARVTLVTEADATEFVAAREALKESVGDSWGFTPGYNDLLALIVSRALREFPYMNARLSADGKTIEWLGHVNLGMAVDTERGLTVPVVPDADLKGLREFGACFRELVVRARSGRSLPDDLANGTFTITNLGMYEIDAFTPVINLPEAAILGVGRINGKVVPYHNEIQVRQMMTLSLVFDHRLTDGAPAARFLQRIKQMVETPFLLLS